MKSVKERDNLDLLELVCQLHSRAVNQAHNKLMHDAYVEARKEMESRLSTLSDNTQSIDKELAGKIWDAAEEFSNECWCGQCDYCNTVSKRPPDKETFINSLNLDNTQIRDGVIECPKSSTGKHEYMIRAYNLGLPKQKECVICGYVDEAYTPL